MPTKAQRLPGDEIVERIKKNLGLGDRSEFHGPLATALACQPSKTAWRRFAKAEPGKWARAVAELARTAGFADRKEIHIAKPEPEAVAQSLVAKYGYDDAVLMWKPTGLPMAIIEAHNPAIEGEFSVVER